MSAQDEGLNVSRRTVFIMIFVSLCVNVFFLLMGILIGKDDLKWLTQFGQNEPAQEVAVDSPENPASKSLEEDLSLFENGNSTERPPPISAEFLDKNAKVPDRPDPRSTAPAEEGMALEEPETVVSSVTNEASAEVPPKVPAPKEEAEPTKKEVNTPAPKGSFWIQVTAISDSKKAMEIRDNLRSKGFKAVLVSEGAYHKVRVGPYPVRDQASGDIAKISQQLNFKGFVLQN